MGRPVIAVVALPHGLTHKYLRAMIVGRWDRKIAIVEVGARSSTFVDHCFPNLFHKANDGCSNMRKSPKRDDKDICEFRAFCSSTWMPEVPVMLLMATVARLEARNKVRQGPSSVALRLRG